MRLENCIRRWLGMKAHRVRRVREEAGRLVAEVEAIERCRPRCGCCGQRVRRTKGRTRLRFWRDLKIRHLPLVIAYTPRRIVCPNCGVRVERIPWANRWSRVTQSLVVAVAKLSRRTDLTTVARQFAIGWKTVAGILRQVVQWGLARRRKKPLRIIGIDEVSRKKGHRYLTVVYDLQRGQLVWVGKDRTKETLERFFDELGKRRSRNLQAVSLDMWASYSDVVGRRAPQATICFDRFHVVGHLNEAVDEVRRSLMRKLSGPAKALVKGTRFVLLKNPWNLTPKQRRALQALVRSNNPLTRAYYLKEDFQRFWDYIHDRRAARHLKQWLWWASHSRLDPFKDFARMIRRHLDGILAWTNLRINNGALEGMNNKIKLVSHRSYGFRNDHRYIEAVYHNCAKLPLPLESNHMK